MKTLATPVNREVYETQNKSSIVRTKWWEGGTECDDRRGLRNGTSNYATAIQSKSPSLQRDGLSTREREKNLSLGTGGGGVLTEEGGGLV